MYTIRHSTYSLRMMEIIDVDWKVITDHLWDTSEFIIEHSLDKQGLMVEDLDICHLDPGGMLNTREEFKKFKVDKWLFQVQLSKLEWVIAKVKKADERVPGYMRFGMWRWNVVLSNRLYNKLLEKLQSLSKTDEALHAQISDYELKSKLEKSGKIIFPDIPRE